jgi:SAM-dependent methyltransferase
MPDTETSEGDLVLHLPRSADAGGEQDAEWCEVETADGRRRVRFHDYAAVYAVPGLYEQLFYDELECASPQTVRGLLEDVLERREIQPEELVVLDLGAGNGMVGEELDDLGAGRIVGVDILPDAAAATERDRPHVYDDYRVVDLSDPPAADHEALADEGFNCLMSVAALGFGDIPPAAFAQAFDYVGDGGLLAFTIKERFTDVARDDTGFSGLLHRLQHDGLIEPLVEQRYRHRLSSTGDPLHYMAYVAQKRGDSEIAPELVAG